MHYILDNWSFDPFLIIVAVVVAVHEIGLRRLARRSRPERTRERRIRSLWFYAGLLVLLLAVDSPIDYWSDSYFMVHMVQHLLLMFAAPSLVVAGAPGQPLLDALPGRSGQDGDPVGARRRLVTAAAGRLRFLTGPLVAVVLFNLAMVVWHIPAAFDLAAEQPRSAHLAEHGSFFATGVLFWLQFIPSPPVPLADAAARPGRRAARHQRRDDLPRDGAVDLRDPLHLRAVRPRPRRDAAPFADQQIGAAILWVCGDFWALPTMILTIRKLLSRRDRNRDGARPARPPGSRAATSRSWTARAPRQG